MKRILVLFLLFFACEEKKNVETSKLPDDLGIELNNFLRNFQEIKIEDLKKIDFDRVQNNDRIDSVYVAKFLCFDRNSCFFTKSSIMNSYSELFRFVFSEKIDLIFYTINEPPVDVKVFVAAVNKLENRINSKLLISNFNPREDYVDYTLEIEDNLDFKITRIFAVNNYYTEPSNDDEVVNSKKIITQIYFCDENGYFHLKN